MPKKRLWQATIKKHDRDTDFYYLATDLDVHLFKVSGAFRLQYLYIQMHHRGVYIYICINTLMYIYIHNYIYRERENHLLDRVCLDKFWRTDCRLWPPFLSVSVCFAADLAGIEEANAAVWHAFWNLHSLHSHPGSLYPSRPLHPPVSCVVKIAAGSWLQDDFQGIYVSHYIYIIYTVNSIESSSLVKQVPCNLAHKTLSCVSFHMHAIIPLKYGAQHDESVGWKLAHRFRHFSCLSGKILSLFALSWGQRLDWESKAKTSRRHYRTRYLEFELVGSNGICI
jgi:hypothetical protein